MAWNKVCAPLFIELSNATKNVTRGHNFKDLTITNKQNKQPNLMYGSTNVKFG